ncbi:MAG TPA: hypothetical protein VGU73_11415 [Acidimicrobiia bacterium]|nr:hypothetical protein [Acidimicrobiia bacterium]
MTSRAARRRRRRIVRRRIGLAVVLVLLAAGGGVYALTRSPSAAPRTVRTAATTTSTTTTTLPPTTTTTVDPGTLPQTMDKPTTTSAQFQAGLAGFWQAIVTDNPAPAMPFFFPLSAYLQVKAISNPAGDWQGRLVADYQADIHTYHGTLGAGAATAQLTGIDVPNTAQWIQPGAEYNKGSYWRVYSTQVHYTVGGQAGTFTIASMISWRGEWYIVHLASIR